VVQGLGAAVLVTDELIVLLFSLASLTGGIASSEIVLILARVVQGLGAAVLVTDELMLLVCFLSSVQNIGIGSLQTLELLCGPLL
jgi:MFS family permease